MMKKLFWLLPILAGLLIMAVIALYSYSHHQMTRPLKLEQAELFEVKSGFSLGTIGRQFVKNDWLDTRFWLRFYSKFHPELGQIKEGVYLIEPKTSLHDAIKLIVSGNEHQFKITFIEGSKFSEWLTALASAPYLKQTLPKLSHDQIAQKLQIDSEAIEGWLFPETYAYTAGMTDIDLLKIAHQKMDSVLNQLWTERQGDLPYDTPYQVLIMASIIEKETGQLAEQPTIAAVFVNRLRKKMRLQTDPTVIYGLGERYDGNITKAHLRQKTRYNTYRINGLPPTPIAMPGRSAIEAALNPDGSDYLYFVSKGNGWHQFSKTLAQHNKAVAKYQLGQ